MYTLRIFSVNGAVFSITINRLPHLSVIPCILLLDSVKDEWQGTSVSLKLHTSKNSESERTTHMLWVAKRPVVRASPKFPRPD